MRIEIPNWIRPQVRERDGTEDRLVDVYIGETVVFTATADTWYDDEDAEMEAMSQFGEMLKRVFDRVETLSGDEPSPVKIGD